MKATSSTVTTRILEWEFTGEEIIAALRESGRLPAFVTDSEPSAKSKEVWVRVPGGGDWSNTNLDLNDHPVQIKVVLETRA